MNTAPSTYRVVQMTPCLRRVLALPRRTWTAKDGEELAEQLTSVLKTHRGTMRLRAIQAIALYEAWADKNAAQRGGTGLGEAGRGSARQGAFFPIRVGAGKTLISLLLPMVLESKRPLLIIPAKLIAKTQREMRALMAHWRIPTFIRVVSYELLGRVQAAEMLDRYCPDLVVCDEAHRVKSPRAAVTRRLMRYLHAHPMTALVAMSGTITRRSLHDYAHLLRRSLGAEAAPIPKHHSETEDWANALDETKAERSIGLGALANLPRDKEARISTELEATRKAYRRRLVETIGVVATTELFEGASLNITSVRPKTSPEVAMALNKLRCAWLLPNGMPLATGLDVWRHARELALGFYYEWDPPPPRPWLDARREWCSACRKILGNNRRALDSELQVANAVDDGHYPDAAVALESWRAVRDTYKPNTVPVWIDDSVLQFCAQWMKAQPGIVWCEHRAFARRLAELTGAPYFGARGMDATGRVIEDAPTDRSIVASIASNSEGRNLQHWNRNLITSPMTGGLEWEQLTGRTHREGQEADEVSFDVIVTCDEHKEAIEQALRDAQYIESVTGQAQKLNYCDKDL